MIEQDIRYGSLNFTKYNQVNKRLKELFVDKDLDRTWYDFDDNMTQSVGVK
ncbi:predicted protein [Sclerotinia sclerotiorum 1980 UF-70]|uniref:Uncharacterized protein n=1 Tax=Sclerotinia sclerotiorum (strain ATCC 18683 / 1980 / Ss-1) TaxID=665079 RepID=A7EPY9_SCLS1|nr:predicted protein [Sclerotinia sclerotiorum 1980 UF-70]EDO04905.1 predicted protein [Sclerotinia sclerotiorum 1980 UF-70]